LNSTERYVEKLAAEHNKVLTPEKKKELVDMLKFNEDDWNAVVEHCKSLPEIPEGENELLDHYREKDEDGNYKHDVFKDLEKMNTDKDGNCECSMCGETFKIAETHVNVCPECMEDSF